MADLVVDLYGVRIGTLVGNWRTFDFIPERAAVNAFGIDSPMLSVAVPLSAVPTRAHKARRRNFFEELLPEGRMLTRMADDARLPPHDSIGLLRAYGRDVAGALQIWDPESPGEPRHPVLEPQTTSGVAQLLNGVQDNPLGNKPLGGKTSLPGVQDKIVLARTDATWNRVIDGYPSTHILKPVALDQPSMIYDEEYGSRFARTLGLAAFHTWIENFDATPALIIERYDRGPNTPEGRIHQEDFNQALGASGNEKYQTHGGRASLIRIANVLEEFTSPDSLIRLLQMTVLAVAVGNLDMHAKNISLLHHMDGSLALAPAYDVVPQTHHANDGEMALAIGQEYRHGAIARTHLISEANSWGLADPEKIIDDALLTILETAAGAAPHPRAHHELPSDITRFTTNLISGRPAGHT